MGVPLVFPSSWEEKKKQTWKKFETKELKEKKHWGVPMPSMCVIRFYYLKPSEPSSPSQHNKAAVRESSSGGRWRPLVLLSPWYHFANAWKHIRVGEEIMGNFNKLFYHEGFRGFHVQTRSRRVLPSFASNLARWPLAILQQKIALWPKLIFPKTTIIKRVKLLKGQQELQTRLIMTLCIIKV